MFLDLTLIYIYYSTIISKIMMQFLCYIIDGLSNYTEIQIFVVSQWNMDIRWKREN